MMAKWMAPILFTATLFGFQSDDVFQSYRAHLAAADALMRLGDNGEAAQWLEQAPETSRDWEWFYLKVQSQADKEAGRGPAVPSRDGSAAPWRALPVLKQSGSVTGLAFSFDGRVLVSGSSNGSTTIWDVALLASVREDAGPGAAVSSLSFSQKENRMISSYTNGAVLLWGIESWSSRRLGDQLTDNVFAVLDHSGRTAAIASHSGRIRLWDLESAGIRKEMDALSPNVIAINPRERQLASGSTKGPITLWDMATGSQRFTLAGHQDGVTAMVFDPFGKVLISASSDGSIRAWDAKIGSELYRLDEHQKPVRSLALSPNGKRRVSCGEDGSLRIWDVHTGVSLLVLERFEAKPTIAAFHPDGKRLAVGREDGAIEILDGVPISDRNAERQASLTRLTKSASE